MSCWIRRQGSFLYSKRETRLAVPPLPLLGLLQARAVPRGTVGSSKKGFVASSSLAMSSFVRLNPDLLNGLTPCAAATDRRKPITTNAANALARIMLFTLPLGRMLLFA